MNTEHIPTEEEFARAKQSMEARYRDLDAVESAILARFTSRCALHSVYLLAQQDVHFRLYVFFHKNSDLDDCKADGTIAAIEDALYEELERVGRGSRAELRVAFEYDSDENVTEHFGGDYLSRLR